MDAVCLRAYGRTVGIHGSASAVDEVLAGLPASYALTDEAPERVWSIGSGGSTDPARLLSELELWVAERARRHVFVHAGSVAWKGRAILVPGRSMSGKSSLVAALVRAGATYLSDEYAVLTPVGTVRPYARPIALRPYDGSPPHRVRLPEPDARAVPAGVVLRLPYTGAHRLQPLSRAEAALHLVDNCVAARSRPRAVRTAVLAVTRASVAWHGTRGDADEMAQTLLARGLELEVVGRAEGLVIS